MRSKERWKGITRRDFLRGAAGATLAGAAGLNAWSQETGRSLTSEAAPAQRAKVILVRDENVLSESGQVNGEVLARMLDDGVNALLGRSDPVEAWKQLVKSSDTVGIKSNAWRFLPTPPELEEAIKQRLIGAGVAPERIGIDDRGVRHNPLFQQATALINVRPMHTHHWAGVGSLIKNYIMFSDSPPSWHDDACANLAGLWELPAVKGKTRLNILVMLTPLFSGKGPHHFQPEYTWPYKGLLVGTDPVAVDATGVHILEAKRRLFFGKDEPFTVSPKHIGVAEEKFHLGVADPNRIDVQKLGWTKDILI